MGKLCHRQVPKVLSKRRLPLKRHKKYLVEEAAQMDADEQVEVWLELSRSGVQFGALDSG